MSDAIESLERKIVIRPFYRDFDHFTRGFWALCELDEGFRRLFTKSEVPKPLEGYLDPKAISENEIEAQMRVFGSVLATPYYIDLESELAKHMPEIKPNSFRFKTYGVHFQIERVKMPATNSVWRFTIYPPDATDEILMGFKSTFRDAEWIELR